MMCSVQGDLLLFAAGPPAVVNAALDKVRQFLAAELNEIPADSHAITWITDWPMFESSEEDGRLQVSPCNSVYILSAWPINTSRRRTFQTADASS